MKHILFTLLVCSLTFSATAKSSVAFVGIDTVLTDEKVSYEFSEDANNVMVNISTTDEKTIMSILHLGVSVFFDIKGKKKQNVYIKYPSESIATNRKQPKGDRRGTNRSEEDQEHRRKKIKKIIESDYHQFAEYGYYNDTEEFNILLNNLAISVSFTYDEVEGLFEYELKLPKTKINIDSKKDLSKLTIGVKTVKEKKKQNNDGSLNGNLGGLTIGGQQGGGRSGGGQGGPPGGGGRKGGGGQGGQRGGPPNSADQSRPSDVLLNYWFKANS